MKRLLRSDGKLGSGQEAPDGLVTIQWPPADVSNPRVAQLTSAISSDVLFSRFMSYIKQKQSVCLHWFDKKTIY